MSQILVLVFVFRLCFFLYFGTLCNIFLKARQIVGTAVDRFLHEDLGFSFFLSFFFFYYPV